MEVKKNKVSAEKHEFIKNFMNDHKGEWVNYHRGRNYEIILDDVDTREYHLSPNYLLDHTKFEFRSVPYVYHEYSPEEFADLVNEFINEGGDFGKFKFEDGKFKEEAYLNQIKFTGIK